MNSAEEITRGTKAKAILDDALFKESVEMVQQSILDEFASTAPENTDGLRMTRLKLNALAEMVRQLASVMETGKLAEAQQEHERTLAQRAKDRMKAGLRGAFSGT